MFLYDVTSVYFEGQDNELAAFGYNRDGKRGKQQMVAGLLTDGAGEPLSIQLYAGNTNDPPTFLDAVEQLKVRFGTEEIAVVGDRGMIKALGQAALGDPPMAIGLSLIHIFTTATSWMSRLLPCCWMRPASAA